MHLKPCSIVMSRFHNYAVACNLILRVKQVITIFLFKKSIKKLNKGLSKCFLLLLLFLLNFNSKCLIFQQKLEHIGTGYKVLNVYISPANHGSLLYPVAI